MPERRPRPSQWASVGVPTVQPMPARECTRDRQRELRARAESGVRRQHAQSRSAARSSRPVWTRSVCRHAFARSSCDAVSGVSAVTCSASAALSSISVSKPSITRPTLPNRRPSEPDGSRKPRCRRPGASNVRVSRRAIRIRDELVRTAWRMAASHRLVGRCRARLDKQCPFPSSARQSSSGCSAAQLFRLEDSLSRRSECDETTSQVGLRQRRTGVELQVLSGRRRSDLAFAPSTEALRIQVVDV